MITVSMCMIVKNEEDNLGRCLESVTDLMDEIVIVDTGSTDRTKEIAAKYTDLIYDYTWIGDFADARNFAFSKATKDYIYSADADEILDEINRTKFLQLKQTLLSEIEIVQMKYGNQLQFSTIYNYDEELRPKLFKRLRTFRWKEPIHETIVLEPVIYDSDIVIKHCPKECHSHRDFEVFEKMTAEGIRLAKRMHGLYARELFVSGGTEDFLHAEDFFVKSTQDTERSSEELMEAFAVAARTARIRGDHTQFMKYAMKAVAANGCSEVCYELGSFYLEQKDYEEAAIWFYNAAYETECILNIHCGSDWALLKLADCQELLGNLEAAEDYRQQADGVLIR